MADGKSMEKFDFKCIVVGWCTHWQEDVLKPIAMMNTLLNFKKKQKQENINEYTRYMYLKCQIKIY